MSSLKNTLVAGIMALSTIATAQQVDTVTDTTNKSLYTVVSDTTQADNTAQVDDYVNTAVVTKGTIPTYQNPRKNSLVDFLQNNGLVEGFYKYKSNAYIQVKFKMEGKNTRIVVKTYQLTDESSDFAAFAVDRIILDGYGHYLPRNPYSSEEAWLFESFLVSTPLSYVGPMRPLPANL